MATFILFGKYCPDALKGVSTVRTKKAAALVRKLKGKVVGMYAMLGETDLVFILELPGLGGHEGIRGIVQAHRHLVHHGAGRLRGSLRQPDGRALITQRRVSRDALQVRATDPEGSRPVQLKSMGGGTS